MKKIFRKEVLVGFIALFALAILFIGIDFLKGVNVFKAANYYYVSYTDVQGLAVSAPVTVNGFKVGQVREINYQYDNPGHVLVELSLDRQLRVPQGTKAVLAADLLGTASIQLDMSSDATYHKIGDELEGVTASGMMDNVSKTLMPAVEAIFPKIDTLLTSLNTIVGDPALAASVKRLDAISANIETTTQRLNALMASMPAIANNINSITANFDTVSADMAVVSGQLRQMPVDSLMQNLVAVSSSLRLLTEQLNDPNSSIGRLTHDPALYENLNSTISSLDSLFVDIKKNPKRYISIKLL